MELLIVLAVLSCLGAAVGIIYRRLSAPTTLPVTAAWIDDLSVDRYQPMTRLLAEEDLRFLRSHAGSDRKTLAAFRRQRCAVFQSYLRCLHADFQRVCMALKIIMVQSRYDRPDLARVLIHGQRAFVFGLMMVQVRVLLYRWGLASVEVGGLLSLFDAARLELRTLVPAQFDMAL
jgi:hypothetical protein